ncbi:hypothetical protein [Stenotrophomonas rhizophila]|uniref:hypothetical protein n=1 Tax=Stenotrophomonas rhizophila TaxID=216778 RepID=UPI001E5B25FB|nr:hypothetical protein [Stenotrophomonas rhizophila]MCC7632661.1 hypothetical protein [Stenotrophomonas rhizophila]MCC7663513.1 hypothetical protein [Stenotrophomonas rhizophila]
MRSTTRPIRAFSPAIALPSSSIYRGGASRADCIANAGGEKSVMRDENTVRVRA